MGSEVRWSPGLKQGEWCIPITVKQAKGCEDERTGTKGADVKVRIFFGGYDIRNVLIKRRYQGYNKDLIDRFVSMGFDLDRVVEAFNFVGIDRMDGQDYELEEAYMGDITARLLGEP